MTDVSKQRLLLATRNADKTREVRDILGDRFVVEDLTARREIPDVEETGATFEDNARLKAEAGSLHYDDWVVADDSGLEVDALSGAPGVRSARFAGDGATMQENRALLLAQLRDFPPDKRRARFRCALALARGGSVVRIFSGTVEGVIAPCDRGAGGFGYDRLFVPDGGERTFAEMTPDEKHALSHRGRALAGLAGYLRGLA